MSRLIDRLTARLHRDRDLPPAYRAMKAMRYVCGRLLAPLYLARCDRVGRGARVHARPLIDNAGVIDIGEDVNIASPFSRVRLVTAPSAQLTIGRGVTINFGTHIAAESRITIGNGVSFGPYVEVVDHDGSGDPAPVDIGDDVWVAARAKIAKGVTIGKGTVVTAGSVVTASLPEGVIAGGNPAVVLRRRHEALADPVLLDRAAAADPGADTPPPAANDEASSSSRGIVIADFSVDELAAILRRDDGALARRLSVDVAPFDQVVQSLHQLGASGVSGHFDFAVVWTRPDAAIRGFQAVLAQQPVSTESVLEEVDGFADLIRQAARSVRHMFVATWTLPPAHRGRGMADMKPGGVAHTLMQMNLRLAAALEAESSVFVLNADAWCRTAAEAWTPKLWYLGKVGFPREVLAEAAADIRAALAGVAGAARKLVVVDLDDTMWGGVVGDVGWEKLRLGGHDALGEALVDFQRQLKALAGRGVLLAIASKNEETVALEAIERHPEMLLRREDFSACRINWRDKAQNIVEIAAELNLGLQSVVFIDDNPFERVRVREALPDVFVPEWPEDKYLYATALLRLRCFDRPNLTAEDRSRTAMYADERKRHDDQALFQSLDDWLVSLGTRVRFEPLDAGNLTRAAQLLNKTNQMNLRTRRLTEAELSAWAAEACHEVWTVHVSDKYGDAGLTGILSLEPCGESLHIADYVLSCRVMGRNVEATMVAAAAHRARAVDASRLVADYVCTAKNKPCLDFWMRSGCHVDEDDGRFTWDTRAPYAAPPAIAVEGLPLTFDPLDVCAATNPAASRALEVFSRR